jgi:hypothetical protein
VAPIDRHVVLARIAHDVGLATWFGGALMGAAAMNAATREVDEPTQRTRVANAGWTRWTPVAAVAISTHLAGVAGLRCSDRRRGEAVPSWAVRWALTAVALGAVAETGRSGRTVVRAGDVPVATAVHPVRATPPAVARAQRRLRVAQWIVPAATGALWGVAARQDAARSGPACST